MTDKVFARILSAFSGLGLFLAGLFFMILDLWIGLILIFIACILWFISYCLDDEYNPIGPIT